VNAEPSANVKNLAPGPSFGETCNDKYPSPDRGRTDLERPCWILVEPSAPRCGTGKALLVWATDVAKKLGTTRLTIADPDAAPFYRKMGAYDVGQAPSGSVPERSLTKLAMNLCVAD
jgi:GNAT superfamily N-acetyltransferase